MSRRTELFRMAALPAAALLIAGLGAGGANAQKADIQIGLTAALTGPFNEYGEGVRRGAEMAIDEWNAKGGVAGRKVALGVAMDDQMVPDRAVQNMRRILDNADIVALIAPSGSSPALAVVDMVEADGRPMCAPQAQAPAVVYPNGVGSPPRKNVFSISIPNAVEAAAMADALAGKYQNVAILYESTGYGSTFADDFKKTLLERNPNQTVTAESFNQRSPDMTAQVARIQNSGAEVLVFAGLGADLAVIRKNMARLNIAIPLYTTAGGVSQPYIEGAGDLVIGTRALNTAVMAQNPYPPETQKALDLYVKKFGKDRWWGKDETRPQVTLARTVFGGYECVNMILTAIQNAGSTEPDAIINALNQFKDYKGAVVESISFSEKNHDSVTAKDLATFEMKSTATGLALLPLEGQD